MFQTINAVYQDSIVFFEDSLTGNYASIGAVIEQIMANINEIKHNANVTWSEHNAFSEYLDWRYELLSQKLSYANSLHSGHVRNFELAGLLQDSQTTLSIIHKVWGDDNA